MAFADPFTPSFFRRLQQLKIRTRRTFLGSRQGSHLSHRKGQGLEFSDYRPYTPGDDFRHIDWGIYGRTDRVYVREFREEQDLNVMVLLDASASMAVPEGEGKFPFAQDIALSLGYVALTDGDSVTFSILGHSNTPRYSGPKALSRAARAVREVEPAGSFDLATEIRAAVARHRIPGKCFFISDCLYPVEELFAGLDVLRFKNFEIAIVQVLAPSELKLDLEANSLVVDAETGATLELSLGGRSAQEYALALAEHIDAIEQYSVKYGISHVLTSSADQVADVVLTRFPEEGLLR